ncbi:MAG TPA: phosphotransferase [Polyangiaceae bacterium]|nr:phosphotransferase [Polyangiaceae bacterium]
MRRVAAAEGCELGPRLQPLWGGYGDLWRAELTRAGKISSVIVKDVRPPAVDGGVAHRRKLRSYRVEQVFYERYAARCDDACRVPRALGLGAEHGMFLSVLEDLDAAGFAGRRSRVDATELSAVLGWLAAFHAVFLGQSPDDLWKVGTYWHLATRPDELARLERPLLRKAAGGIDARLNSARFRTFVHGDAKLENVCFAPGGRVALVDFQYVGGGVGVKDVAYFLSSCLSPAECAALIPGHLDQYFGALRAALATRYAPVELDALEHEWRELFPLAWVDFYRFLLGWAPGRCDPDPFSDALVAQVLRAS